MIFASDNGPWGENAREFGNQGTPDMGSPGPSRGEPGEVTEGSIRTAALIRWPGHVAPDSSSPAMFSIMDFLPTLASILGPRAGPSAALSAAPPRHRLARYGTPPGSRGEGI
ncbi:sulfatase-like hydrolase/transferase [Amaricoccus solimangrovi]|uniref:sulfatase-like hydrolase/transferase n=1 Tax=Amaricoccus solimangrovi TaxID=2589815 RepID=UPI0034D1CA18